MTLEEMIARHRLRSQDRTVIRGAVPGITPMGGNADFAALKRAPSRRDHLDLGGTPIFVLGLDNPDDPDIDFYIP